MPYKAMRLLRIIGASALMSVLWMLDAPSRAEIINVPCFDAGGSAGWVHTDNLPRSYYPIVLLGVSQLKPGFYESHPMYGERIHALDPRIKYGYCAYSTSDKSIFKECLGNYPTTIRINECSAQRLKQSGLSLKNLLDKNAFSKWRKVRDKLCSISYQSVEKGSIYNQMILGCRYRLNKALLEELTHLSE